jgi:flagellar biogenesis protein FliO
MTRVKKIIVIFLFIAMQAKSFAEEVRQHTVQITAIEPEFSEKKTYIHIQFDKSPQWELMPVLEDHNTFIQMNLKDIVPQFPGKFWDVNSSLISKVALFKTSNSNAAIRVFPQEGRVVNISDFSVEQLGSRLIISVNHSAQVEKGNSKGLVGPPHYPQSNFLEQKTHIEDASHESVTSSDILKVNEKLDDSMNKKSDNHEHNQKSERANTSAEEDLSGRNTQNLQNILVKIAIFIGAVVAIGVLILTKRKFALLRTLEVAGEKVPTILNLSTLPVSQKQKINLIQVGAERFLIGVSPGEIRLLTGISTIQPDKKLESKVISNFQREMLEQGYKEGMSTTVPNSDFENKNRKLPRSQEKILEPLQSRLKSGGSRKNKSNPLQEDEVDGEIQIEVPRVKPKVRISIGDDGIKNLSPRNMNEDLQKPSKGRRENVADDVTKLIRERISGLKNI